MKFTERTWQGKKIHQIMELKGKGHYRGAKYLIEVEEESGVSDVYYDGYSDGTFQYLVPVNRYWSFSDFKVDAFYRKADYKDRVYRITEWDVVDQEVYIDGEWVDNGEGWEWSNSPTGEFKPCVVQ